MKIINHLFHLKTGHGIKIYNITPQIEERTSRSQITNGQAIVFSRHTTTAIAINENEERLFADLVDYLEKLAPPNAPYLHNDLHLRDVPPDEPENAHSHLMAITLSTSEVIPIAEGKLALGKWQSVLLLELDGPREREVFVQLSGV